MKIITEVFTGRQELRVIHPAISVLIPPMHREMSRVFIRIEIMNFHKIDFAGSRPTDIGEIRAEGPECRPRGLACRRFNSGNDLSEFEIELAERVDPARRDRAVADATGRSGAQC